MTRSIINWPVHPTGPPRPVAPAHASPRCSVGGLAEPRVRVALGAAGVLLTALMADSDRVGPRETRVFQLVNDLPDCLFGPTWIVMQLGTLGAAPAIAGVAYLAGQPRLARRLLVNGTMTWALSKLVKHIVGRPRPAALLPGARRRGRDASGLGYLSGHAGVAAGLGLAALPHLRGRNRLMTVALVPLVGLSRIYVGAHLPLDVVGGASLGVAVEAAVALGQDMRK